MKTDMRKVLLTLLSIALLASCTKTQAPVEKFSARGADLGWLSEMEHDSMLFFNAEGDTTDCILLLKEAGCNAVRLRVWVNHSTGWSNLPDVLAQAKRVKEAALPLMIDIHYSDFFADPQRQDVPEAWKGDTIMSLKEHVAAHTTEVLQTLKDNGITPTWVQIGNETTYGTLWPYAQLDKPTIDAEAYEPTDSLPEEGLAQWLPYAELSNAGYDAAKAVFPEIICIVHIDNAFIPRVNWFKRFRDAGGKWDMIGLSHYPFTQDTIAPEVMNDLCREDIIALHTTYGCEVMVVEIGTASWIPDSAAQCMRDFREKTDSLEGYAGVFYWEPQVYAGWRPAEYIPLGWGSYGMGAFTEKGTLSEALHILYRKQTEGSTENN